MRATTSADNAAAHALLTCWIREKPDQVQVRDEATIVIPLPRWNACIAASIERWSSTFRHKLAMPAVIEVDGSAPRPIGLATLAALLTEELSAGRDSESLLGRILDSRAAVATSLERRDADIEKLWGPGPLAFGESEQALLLGHAAHPTPKSRTEMSATARAAFSPELSGRFPLRWLAVDRSLARLGSALGTAAPDLAEELLRADPRTDNAALDATLRALDGERVLMPAHPYEADWLASHEDYRDLFETGAVVDLGEWGSPYLPTTSVRTVYRADAAWQLKFSLHVSITNSMRVTLPKELDRAVESARLATTEIGTQARAVAPNFVLIQDPAYLTLARGDQVMNGFSVLFRTNRWTPDGPRDVTALTTLCQDHPYCGRTRLAAVVGAIAEREHRRESDVGREWFGRFCDVVVRSLVRLYLDVGLCFEAHQQNTLVEMVDGWPVRGVYRDSQGYFHREAAHEDFVQIMPGVGEATESIFSEKLADERLVYYLFVNLTLGVINTLGDCVDETVLLADLRDLLEGERRRGGRYPATLLDRLLDDDKWPCKANLLTRAHDMDELVGDIADQSVYVSVPNPLPPRQKPWSVRIDGVRLDATPVDVVAHSALIHDWMNRPHVAPWWEVERTDTLSYLRSLRHAQPWIFAADGEPFGYVETYRVRDDALAEYYDARPDDRGWHVLVGPEKLLGSGIPRMMGRAVVQRLLEQGGRVVCEPDVRNTRMHAFCKRLGFYELGEIELPDKRALLLACTARSSDQWILRSGGRHEI